MSLKFRAVCSENQVGEATECLNVPIAKKVKFDVEVTLQQCPKDPSKKIAPFPISIPGFGSVKVEVEPICDCDCAQGNKPEENSTFCSNGNGTFTCGICDCHPGRYGKICECDSPFDQQSDVKNCVGNNTDDTPCSGKGQCICGKCECNKDPRGLIFGDKCQCDNFNCPQDNGDPCGGPTQGECNCGKCQCKGVFIGVNCGQRNCSLLGEECKKPNSQKTCSGADRGECVCGECKCKAEYTGKFCEECPGCEGGVCSRNKDCVVCTAGFDRQSLDQCKKSNRCEELVISVETVSDIKVKTSKGLYRCDHKDSNDCLYLFTYEYVDDKDPNNLDYKLFVEKKCPEEPNILAIVLGVIGGIVGIGLILLLIWKLLIMMADRVEYQKFERERQKSKWKKDENPLYKGAKTTFENPTYAGGK